MTDIYAEELYNPSFQITSARESSTAEIPVTALPAYDVLAQGLEGANRNILARRICKHLCLLENYRLLGKEFLLIYWTIALNNKYRVSSLVLLHKCRNNRRQRVMRKHLRSN